MPNLILDLEVDRVDLVDEGANSASFIKLYKRKESEKPMEFSDILKKLKPEHKDIVEGEIAKAKKEADQKVVDLTEQLKKVEAELDLAKKKPETNEEPEFEEVLKNLDPSIQKVFKNLQAQKETAEAIAKAAAEEKEEQEAIAKAKELKALPVENEKLVEVVKNITPEVFDILKAANKALEDGGLFDELGVSKSKEPSSESSAWEAIEKAAKKIVEKDNVSIEKARTIAIKENPDLYREYLKGDVN